MLRTDLSPVERVDASGCAVVHERSFRSEMKTQKQGNHTVPHVHNLIFSLMQIHKQRDFHANILRLITCGSSINISDRWSSPVHRGVPSGSQRQVYHHVYGNQIGHRVITGSHGAQDALPSLHRDTQNTRSPSERTPAEPNAPYAFVWLWASQRRLEAQTA